MLGLSERTDAYPPRAKKTKCLSVYEDSWGAIRVYPPPRWLPLRRSGGESIPPYSESERHGQTVRRKSYTLPILLVSAGVAELNAGGEPEEFMADGFLMKPITPDKLLRKVKALAKLRSKFSNI